MTELCSTEATKESNATLSTLHAVARSSERRRRLRHLGRKQLGLKKWRQWERGQGCLHKTTSRWRRGSWVELELLRSGKLRLRQSDVTVDSPKIAREEGEHLMLLEGL